MKRLLHYLNHINDGDTATFRYTANEDGRPVQKEIYDGECEVIYLKPNGEPVGDRHGTRREPAYWRDGISYTFARTDRMSADRPTATVAIPAARLGISDFTPAAADHCLRRIKPYYDAVNAEYYNRARPDAYNGKFILYEPGGEVLVRNAAFFAKRPAKDYENGKGSRIFVCEFIEPPPDADCLCVRMEIQLPRGRLKRAKKMLLEDLPDNTERFIEEFDRGALLGALSLEKKQNEIRKFLRDNDYCAFIADGSVLAREDGGALPMKDALPFKSAEGSAVEIAGARGMGVRRGVTVVTGGGYSGKSTVLNAIAAGIYNHAEGDGRELCLTDESAVTITAEDGRAVSCVNISPFIKWIPGRGESSTEFTTARASGSTSQAANIAEAVDCGARLLLIDEDRSATNFMIRDRTMKRLIEKEPITPFTDRVRELSDAGVSTILVIGGSGEYLSAADKIYLMEDFMITDATERAKGLAREINPAASPYPAAAAWGSRRTLMSGGFTSYPRADRSGTERLEVTDTGFIIVGDERIDIRALHDIATAAQADALAFMLRHLMRSREGNGELEALALSMRGLNRAETDRETDICGRINELYEQIAICGLDLVDTGFFISMRRFLDLPREFELHAAINRMRGVVRKRTGG